MTKIEAEKYKRTLFTGYLILMGGLLAYKFVLPIPFDSPFHLGLSRLLPLAGLLTALYLVLAFKAREYFSGVGHPLNLAVFRIYFFYYLLSSLNPEKVLFYSEFPRELIFAPFGTGWLIDAWPLDAVRISWAIKLFTVFCWMGLLGIFTRFSAVMTALLFFYVGGVPQLFGKVNHYQNLLWFNMILAVSPCADYLSVDSVFKAWRRADKGVIAPPPPSRAYDLPIKIIWLMFGMAYFWPGVWKFWESGTAWVFGDALKLHLYAKWTDLGWLPAFRLDQYPLLYKLGGAATILFEVGFIFMIFYPGLRWLAAVMGFSFHTFTNYIMRIGFENLRNFYFVFFPIDRIMAWLGQRFFPRGLTVFFDGNCTLCRRTVATLGVFDLFGRVRYQNALAEETVPELKKAGLDEETVLRDMCAVTDGKIYKGFDAYRLIALRMPVLWPVLPFLYVWPVTGLGRRIYRKIADARACEVPVKRVQLTDPQPSPVPSGLIAVAVLLIAANSYCGVKDIRSGWPFASYPAFSDIPGLIQGTVEFEIIGSGGESYSLENRDYVGKFSPERFTGLVSKILYWDPELREMRLKALWTAMAQKWPKFSAARSVKFYEVKNSRIPEESKHNPLSRELIYELQLR